VHICEVIAVLVDLRGWMENVTESSANDSPDNTWLVRRFALGPLFKLHDDRFILTLSVLAGD
jgi:hypothetical protein